MLNEIIVPNGCYMETIFLGTVRKFKKVYYGSPVLG